MSNQLTKDALELCLKASELLAGVVNSMIAQIKSNNMANTVAAFNAVYGTNLTEQQGLALYDSIKDGYVNVRVVIDGAEDLIAYAALATENTHAALS